MSEECGVLQLQTPIKRSWILALCGLEQQVDKIFTLVFQAGLFKGLQELMNLATSALLV